MTADTDKPIPAAYLRFQEFARQKQARRQKRHERLEKRHERVTQRLAAVLSENAKEVRMDEQHPERIYLKEQHIEKAFQLFDATRGGSTSASFAFANQLAIWYPETKDKMYVLTWGEPGKMGDVLHPWLEPYNLDKEQALSARQATLQQELNQVNARLKTVTMDELKSKMLTLMDVGDVVTVSKPDPNAKPGPQLVKEEPATEVDPPVEQPAEAPAEPPDPAPAPEQ